MISPPGNDHEGGGMHCQGPSAHRHRSICLTLKLLSAPVSITSSSLENVLSTVRAQRISVVSRPSLLCAVSDSPCKADHLPAFCSVLAGPNVHQR